MTLAGHLSRDYTFPLPVTLCMINYNGENYLKDSLQAVVELGEMFSEMILIDNSSEDNSTAIVRQMFPQIHLVQLDENRGPGAARNAGFRTASSEYILFLDNDVFLTPECPPILYRELQNDLSAAVAMPRILYKNNPQIIQYDGAGCHALGQMILYNVNQPLKDATLVSRKINSLVTACFLMNRKRWGSGTPFDESFFFNYEDHDFGIRTRLKGHHILSVPKACCYHGEGTVGLSVRTGKNYSKLRVFCLIRNRWIILLKNYQLKSLIIFFPIFMVYELFQFMVVLKHHWLREWFRAIKWILQNSKEIRLQRLQIQKSRKTSDREILQRDSLPFREDFISGYWGKKGKQLLDWIMIFYLNLIWRFL